MKSWIERIKQGHRTYPFPKIPPVLPERFRGKPVIDLSKCQEHCRECINSCPTGAISFEGTILHFDLGKCLFCNDCIKSCPQKAISFSNDYRLSVYNRENLLIKNNVFDSANEVRKEIKKIFGRSLNLRQVSAGGCNACESDVNVLNTLAFDLGRFGIQFVASPRHADGLLITGPVTQNMKSALLKTYEAVPSPKLVIVVGACAISGGPFINLPEVNNGFEHILPIDLYIPGCPPHPYTILDGLYRLLNLSIKNKFKNSF